MTDKALFITVDIGKQSKDMMGKHQVHLPGF